MRVLQIHNKYQQYGGEDVVLNAEYELLSKNGNIVSQLIFDNNSINSLKSKLSLIYKSIYNKNSGKILEKKINDFKPDIIHVHNFFPIGSSALFFIAKKLNVPIILTLHNFRLICANAELIRNGKECSLCIKKTIPLNGIVHSCYRNSKIQSAGVTIMASINKLMGTWKSKVDGFIALSEYSKKLFIHSSLKLQENKIFIKPNFVKDLNIISESINRKNYFLFVGRLTETKGISIILEAAKRHSFNLLIIGDGPNVNLVKEAALKNPRIIYDGFRNQEYILNKMKECKALIFPSLKIEGFPVTIIEAFSTGTPVICSKIGPLKEIITHNFNGLHHQPGDVYELINLIKIMDTEPETYKELYTNARKTYINNYTPKKNYEMIMSIYQTVLNNYNTTLKKK